MSIRGEVYVPSWRSLCPFVGKISEIRRFLTSKSSSKSSNKSSSKSLYLSRENQEKID